MATPVFAEIQPPTGVFVDGKYRDAVSGEVFENINPATGEK